MDDRQQPAFRHQPSPRRRPQRHLHPPRLHLGPRARDRQPAPHRPAPPRASHLRRPHPPLLTSTQIPTAPRHELGHSPPSRSGALLPCRGQVCHRSRWALYCLIFRIRLSSAAIIVEKQTCQGITFAYKGAFFCTFIRISSKRKKRYLHKKAVFTPRSSQFVFGHLNALRWLNFTLFIKRNL
jgi:hypothetical protein